MLLLSTVTAGAQTIKDGSSWSDGSVLYQAITPFTSSDGYHEKAIKFDGWSPHEGGFEFVLQPQAKAGEYRLSAVESDYIPLYGKVGDRVQKVRLNGQDVLIVRNDNGRATDVLLREHTDTSIIRICEREIITLLRGTYKPSQRTQGNGSPDTRWVITDESITSGLDGKTYPLRLEQVWDQPQPVVQMGEQFFQFIPTVRGLNVYRSEKNEDIIDSGELICLEWADSSRSRFQFLSERVCTWPLLSDFNPEEGRIMRNDIWARHGYVFSDPELRSYFSQQPWYKPGNDNSSIRLSSIEQLNVELIQTMEAQKTNEADDEDEP